MHLVIDIKCVNKEFLNNISRIQPDNKGLKLLYIDCYLYLVFRLHWCISSVILTLLMFMCGVLVEMKFNMAVLDSMQASSVIANPTRMFVIVFYPCLCMFITYEAGV